MKNKLMWRRNKQKLYIVKEIKLRDINVISQRMRKSRFSSMRRVMDQMQIESINTRKFISKTKLKEFLKMHKKSKNKLRESNFELIPATSLTTYKNKR